MDAHVRACHSVPFGAFGLLVEGGSDNHVVASSSRVEETVESLAKERSAVEGRSRVEETVESLAKERSAVEGRAKEFGDLESHAKEEWVEGGPIAIEPSLCRCHGSVAVPLRRHRRWSPVWWQELGDTRRLMERLPKQQHPRVSSHTYANSFGLHTMLHAQPWSRPQSPENSCSTDIHPVPHSRLVTWSYTLTHTLSRHLNKVSLPLPWIFVVLVTLAPITLLRDAILPDSPLLTDDFSKRKPSRLHPESLPSLPRTKFPQES
ncbi:unnamed protein product [Schistocephalus solidus]|uniref:Uncharacterized protein n=1 Tax=Schistocephalus solidus TaxID=70667 RepID=A0A183SY38_SCHSO|nr:unnamed protein product [Schistocephalus solidus]